MIVNLEILDHINADAIAEGECIYACIISRRAADMILSECTQAMFVTYPAADLYGEFSNRWGMGRFNNPPQIASAIVGARPKYIGIQEWFFAIGRFIDKFSDAPVLHTIENNLQRLRDAAAIRVELGMLRRLVVSTLKPKRYPGETLRELNKELATLASIEAGM